MLKYFFALAGSDVTARLTRAGLPPGGVRRLSAHAEIRSVAEDLTREGQRSGPLTLDICLALLDLFLLKFADAAAWSGHGSTLARENFVRCKALIDANAERFATLAEVGHEAGMEVSSMCRLFRRFQGTSPYQYLLRRKMNLAAEFLVDTGGLVKEAAQRVGFADPFHFARCFKAVHGVPPSALRGYR
jgi:AraC-like DNA-binding protein